MEKSFNIKDINLPIQKVHFVIHKGKHSGYRFPEEYHIGHEMFYVDYGEMVIKVEDNEFTLKAGECFIVHQYKRHSIYGKDKKAFSFFNIIYQGDLPDNISNFAFQLNKKEKDLIKEIKKEKNREDIYSDEMLLLKLNTLILFLSRNKQKEVIAKVIKGENKYAQRSSIVERALNILYRDSIHPLSPNYISSQIGISTSHLRKLIKNETGASLAQHLKVIRIEKAKRLLMESADNVDEISRSVGYESVPHFCNLFKKMTGMTPMQYAKSLGTPINSELLNQNYWHVSESS